MKLKYIIPPIGMGIVYVLYRYFKVGELLREKDIQKSFDLGGLEKEVKKDYKIDWEEVSG